MRRRGTLLLLLLLNIPPSSIPIVCLSADFFPLFCHSSSFGYRTHTYSYSGAHTHSLPPIRHCHTASTASFVFSLSYSLPSISHTAQLLSRFLCLTHSHISDTAQPLSSSLCLRRARTLTLPLGMACARVCLSLSPLSFLPFFIGFSSHTISLSLFHTH